MVELADFFYKAREEGLFKSRKIGDITSAFDLPKKKAAKYLRRMMDKRIGKIAVSFNHKKLGIMTALLLVKTSYPSCNKSFFDRALKISFVESVVQVIGGEATHIITIKVPTLKILEETVEKIRGEFLGSSSSASSEESKGLIEWTTTKFVYDYALDQNFSYIGIDEKEVGAVNIDYKDWQLLELLSNNALTPLKEVGKKLGLEAPTVLRRIKILENARIINGYYCKGAWEDAPFKLQPLVLHIFVRYRGATLAIRNFIKSVMGLKKLYAGNIYYLHGEDDLSVTFRTRSVSEFQRFLHSDIINSENIAQIKTYSVTKFGGRPFLHDFAKWAKEQESKSAQ